MRIVLTANQLGKVLKGYRREQKLTQTATGETVGLLQKTVSRLERDTETASIESLFKLLSALNVEMSISRKSEASTSLKRSKVEW